MRIRVLITLLLVVMTVAVFWQTLGNGFTNYDDDEYVTNNGRVQKGLSGESIVWAFTTTHSFNWHPLTWISHMLDWQLYGRNAMGHHLTSLLFHLANVLLLFFVLNRMTKSMWKSAFVAALFGIHPLHVESVAWIAERKDVLSTFFWLLTMLTYVWYVERPGIGKYLLVMLSLALGLMAKPMLVTLPFALLLLDYWPLGRFRVKAAKERSKPQSGWKLVREKIPLFVLAAASCVITVVAQRKGGAVVVLGNLPLGQRVAGALAAYISYIVKMVWPSGLVVFYPHPTNTLPSWQVVGATVLLILVTVLAIKAARSRPYLTVGWLWYVITLLPVIGFVQVGSQAMADRYTYIALTGLFVIVAWGVPDLLGGRVQTGKSGPAKSPRRAEKVSPALAGLAIAALLPFTWLQVGYWRNSVTLFEHALAHTSNNWVACHNLALAKAERHKFAEAIPLYKEALRLMPSDFGAQTNLGLALVELGKIAEAIPHYEEALRINPGSAEAHYNLGCALEKQGKTERAIACYKEALRLAPNFAAVHNNLAGALTKQGRIAEAIPHYREVGRTPSDPAQSHNNLGIALAAERKFDEAIIEYRKALKINPNSADAHNNIGFALIQSRKLDEAIAHLKQAVRLKPDYAEAQNNLGIALAGRGNLDEAVFHYKAAIRMRPDYAKAHNNLGIVLARQKKFGEAVAHLREALRLQPEYGNAHRDLAVVLYLKGDYAGAWREARFAEQYGCPLDPTIMNALATKMPKGRY